MIGASSPNRILLYHMLSLSPSYNSCQFIERTSGGQATPCTYLIVFDLFILIWSYLTPWVRAFACIRFSLHFTFNPFCSLPVASGMAWRGRAQMMWKAEDSSYKIDYDPNDPTERNRNFEKRSTIVLEVEWRQGDRVKMQSRFMPFQSFSWYSCSIWMYIYVYILYINNNIIYIYIRR